jgi:hypothetical protein
MKKLLVSVVAVSLKKYGELSVSSAADISFERALIADREPQSSSCTTETIGATGSRPQGHQSHDQGTARHDRARLFSRAAVTRAISKPRPWSITA